MRPHSHIELSMQAETPGVVVTLARLAREDADATSIAMDAVAVWRDIDAALAPIIGHAGVAALYKRSLHLAQTSHPCLATVYESVSPSDEYATLQSVLSQQTTQDVIAAIGTLLQTFHDLLARLIGESLTGRLLRSVWYPPSSGHAVQDTAS
jgi:hypothetical protein